MKKSRCGMFPARAGELRRINAFLEGFCADAGVGRERCLRLNLVLEELFVNTVKHGHRGDCDAPVWIFLDSDAAAVHVAYEDVAPPFNPYARLEKAAETTGELRKLGGLGVFFTYELASRRDYAYVFGRNRIRLALTR